MEGGNKVRIAGVDEAGRGCVIGPMVVAGILISKEGIERILSLGNLDSKRFSRKGRERMLEIIEEIAMSSSVILISPREIDLSSLTKLEIRATARILCELDPDVAYLDLPVPSSGRGSVTYCDAIREELRKIRPEKSLEIIGENKADSRYPVVGAASILAKVTRDREIERLKEIYGDFGSGYPGDRRTIEFLKDWLSRNGELPDCVRMRWRTIRIQRIVSDRS